MAQRVRIPHRGQCPSSVRQLPILTALHARFPTLFGDIIHQHLEKVNGFFRKFLFGVYGLGKRGLYFVQYDEKDKKLQGKPLDFCAISLYNKGTIWQGGAKHG